MIVSILLALFNGIIVSISRTINGRLSTQVGALKASLANHAGGFLFLTPILFMLGEWKFDVLTQPPLFAYLGGLFGALFVAVNSYVFTKMGAMNGALLVISGQMVSAVLIDCANRNTKPSIAQGLGVLTVLLSIYLTNRSNLSASQSNLRGSTQINF